MKLTTCKVFNPLGPMGNWFFANEAEANEAIKKLGALLRRPIAAELGTLEIADVPDELLKPCPQDIVGLMGQLAASEAKQAKRKEMQKAGSLPNPYGAPAEWFKAIESLLNAIQPPTPAPQFNPNPERNLDP